MSSFVFRFIKRLSDPEGFSRWFMFNQNSNSYQGRRIGKTASWLSPGSRVPLFASSMLLAHPAVSHNCKANQNHRCCAFLLLLQEARCSLGGNRQASEARGLGGERCYNRTDFFFLAAIMNACTFRLHACSVLGQGCPMVRSEGTLRGKPFGRGMMEGRPGWVPELQTRPASPRSGTGLGLCLSPVLSSAWSVLLFYLCPSLSCTRISTTVYHLFFLCVAQCLPCPRLSLL